MHPIPALARHFSNEIYIILNYDKIYSIRRLHFDLGLEAELRTMIDDIWYIICHIPFISWTLDLYLRWGPRDIMTHNSCQIFDALSPLI